MRKQSGFTLVELLIVIGMIIFILLITIPGIMGWLPNYRLRSAAQDLMSNFQKAKLEAVKRNINAAITFSPTGYTVFVDVDNNYIHDTAAEDTVTTVQWSRYPDVSVVSNNVDNSSGKPCIAFRPNGMPAVNTGLANGTVALTIPNGRIANVNVSQAGSITINTIIP